LFDPTLSENLEALPASKQQLKGATGYRIFLPATPTVDFYVFDRLQLPNRRTKLLTPSVASAGVQTLVNHNDRFQRYAYQVLSSIRYFSFSTRIFTVCGNREQP
jgi:hypothetical protein